MTHAEFLWGLAGIMAGCALLVIFWFLTDRWR